MDLNCNMAGNGEEGVNVGAVADLVLLAGH
jgi:hypothetical protein